MRMNRALSLVVAIALSACGQPTRTPSATPEVWQRHDCGNLPADLCQEVIAQVIQQVPAMAGSPIAVAATRHPNALLRRGGDFEALVAFAPFGVMDFWFSPPTWVVTQPMQSSDWRVEPWRNGPLPAQFTTLLRVAGIAA